jgi:calpain-15
MTNGIGLRIDLGKDDVKQSIRNGSLWKDLLAYREGGFLMGAGSPAGADTEANAPQTGIVQGHAYSLLDVQEVDGNKLMQLRNPWGRKEWTGAWSDHSPLWTKRIKSIVKYKDADDGSFWMSFQDFVANFEDVYVCRFFDANHGWQPALSHRGSWVKGQNAGGCTNYPSCVTSPQYGLQLSARGQVVLTLSQDDVRSTGRKFCAIAIEVYDNGGERVTHRKQGKLVATNLESYILRREVSVQFELPPKPYPYTVLLSTFYENKESNFVTMCYSKVACEYTLLPPAE